MCPLSAKSPRSPTSVEQPRFACVWSLTTKIVAVSIRGVLRAMYQKSDTYLHAGIKDSLKRQRPSEQEKEPCEPFYEARQLVLAGLRDKCKHDRKGRVKQHSLCRRQ